MIYYENPFMHILHFEEKYFNAFQKGDNILIQEKIDGANSHIIIDNGVPIAYGNHYILNDWNHNQGFYYWVQNNYKKILPKYYGLNIYGEWLCPHHNEYPSDKYGNFYIFDVIEGFDKNGNEIYWLQDKVKQLAYDCDLQYAPIIFEGKFSNWNNIMKFVGQTKLGGRKGEGIVIKNQDKLNTNGIPFYVKIVDVEFQETNEARNIIKTINIDNILKLEELKSKVEDVVTLPRVRKIILKMMEEKELDINWFEMDIKQSLNKVKRNVYNDCKKESPNVLNEVGNKFGQYCGEFVIKHIKTLQQEYQMNLSFFEQKVEGKI